MKLKFEQSNVRWFIIFLILLVGVVATELVVSAIKREKGAFSQIELNNRGNDVRIFIERYISETILLSSGLIVYVAANPEVDNEAFASIAKSLIKRAPTVSNIGLARNNIITHMYPIEGNEKALGLEYMKIPAQRESVLRAINERNTVIAGPVNLVQGGVGLIGRLPIFLNNDEQSYWGIASVVVDFEKVVESVLKISNAHGIDVALKGEDGKGYSGEVFWGDSELFNPSRASVYKSIIKLPIGEWVLAAEYSEAPAVHASALLARIAGWLITLVIVALSYMLFRAYSIQKGLSLYDSLTGVANRRLFNIKIRDALIRARRSKKLVAVVFIDLDKFKYVNDTYGHKAGDQVLVDTSQRVQSLLRESDTLARVGGDEFVLVLESLASLEDSQGIVRKIQKEIESITIDSTSVHISASIGLSVYPHDGTSGEELLKKADQEMYKMKQRTKE